LPSTPAAGEVQPAVLEEALALSQGGAPPHMVFQQAHA
jgi:hypothetical protein